MSPRPRVGVSACTLGEQVRYDGGHKRSHFVAATLAEHVDYVPVCPEKEVGMGVPRPTLRLVHDEGGGPMRMQETESGRDHSESMRTWAATRVAALADADLDGFILMGKSPSCGMERVRVYRDNGMPHDTAGVGLFAAALLEGLPHLVVEEANRLNDPRLRDHFCYRLFAAARVKALFRGDWSRGEVVAFHAREKMALLAHGRRGYTRLGELVATIAEHEPQAFAAAYRRAFLEALKPIPTRGRMVDAIQHLLGHFKHELEAAEKTEVLATLQEYRVGRLPLAAVTRLVRVLAARHERPWVAEQTLLEAAPPSLALHANIYSA